MLQTNKQTWDIKTVTETKIEYLKKIGTKRKYETQTEWFRSRWKERVKDRDRHGINPIKEISS